MLSIYCSRNSILYLRDNKNAIIITRRVAVVFDTKSSISRNPQPPRTKAEWIVPRSRRGARAVSSTKITYCAFHSSEAAKQIIHNARTCISRLTAPVSPIVVVTLLIRASNNPDSSSMPTIYP